MSRRSMVKGTGGTALLGSLAGCSALIPSAEDGSGGGEGSNTVSGQDSIPSEPLTIAMVTFTSGAASVLYFGRCLRTWSASGKLSANVR